MENETHSLASLPLQLQRINWGRMESGEMKMAPGSQQEKHQLLIHRNSSAALKAYVLHPDIFPAC